MSTQSVGELGEYFVAQCLETNGWVVVAHRWSCQWGELDVVAYAPEPTGLLIFVEVKVRGDRNWDQSGLLSITPRKQQKLILAAQAFLSDNPQFTSYPCRFDVALVSYQKKPCEPYGRDSQGLGLTTLRASSNQSCNDASGCEGAMVDEEFSFAIQHYIQGAFDVA